MACLREKGYAHTTARDLVEASGTNLGAIGYHFGSKEALLNQAIYLGYEQWLDRVAAATLPARAGSFWQTLALAIGEVLNTIEAQRPLCVAFIEALAQAEWSEELRQQIARGYDRYRRAVARYIDATLAHPRNHGDASGASDLSDPSDAAMTIAALVVALMDGLLLQWLVDREKVPTAQEFMTSLRDGIVATGLPIIADDPPAVAEHQPSSHGD